ncbi:LPXTG cell wall anchor domain-containing protein [Gemmiger sp.]|uniref:LPXTG cell wall anchor domain-containing protein n=1 Tax=Gemmiger sp. TaxID=2049027 RepID=UPI003A8CFA47
MQKTNFKTRLLALLTAAFMLVMCVPFAAFAEDAKLAKAIIHYYNEDGSASVFTNETVTDGTILPTDSALVNFTLGEDEELVWKDDKGNTHAPSEKVTIDGLLAELAGTNINPEDGSCHINFYAIAQKKETPAPVELKTVNTHFNKDGSSATTLFADVAVTAELGWVDMPTTSSCVGLAADEVVTGWTVDNGKTYAAGSKVTFEELAAIVGKNIADDGSANVNFRAVIEKKETPAPVELKKVTTHFNKDGNSSTTLFADVAVTPELGWVDMPTTSACVGLAADEVVTGWTTDNGKTYAAGSKVTFEELAAIVGDNIAADGSANVNFRAVIEKKTALTKIKMIFTKADGTTSVFATGELTADSEWYVLPDAAGVINLADGEKLTGWTLFQNGAKYAAGEKVTFESLKELAGKNVDNDGVAYLNFYADLKTDVELKNITIKYVEDKDGVQEDVAAPQNNFTAKDEFTILTDNLYDGKVPAGKKLIGWQYKNGGNTTNFVKGEHVKFDTLKALLNGNWDNEGNAWVTLTPVFQDVKSNNSSSSTSSSSSNKTTTASNQKQVVKAAAAPANTTKVLPKTGASNVAPLLGGSLAVVALLMGYGVYGLVLRKKD